MPRPSAQTKYFWLNLSSFPKNASKIFFICRPAAGRYLRLRILLEWYVCRILRTLPHILALQENHS